MVDASRRLGSHLRTISAGGGLPIPYHEEDKGNRIDMQAYYDLWDKARKNIQQSIGHEVHLEVEPGRYLVAESGYLMAARGSPGSRTRSLPGGRKRLPDGRNPRRQEAGR